VPSIPDSRAHQPKPEPADSPLTSPSSNVGRWFRKRGTILALTAVLTLLLFSIHWLRWLAYPLVLLSTLAHELGHGLSALMVGGSFENLKIWADGSGIATWSGDGGRLGRAAVAAGGLIGPAITAGVLFVFARKPRSARTTLVVLGSMLLLVNLLWVRNLFGFLFVALVAAACLVLGLKTSPAISHFALVFLGVQLALSVFSRADYLFTEVAETSAGPMPSDTAQIAAALWLPFWFWGALCGAISLAMVFFGIRIYLRGSIRSR
jgi:hypothetical protein